MAQQDPPPQVRKKPLLDALPSRFIVGSVSEENSEDEAAARPDITLEGKETRSSSPASSLGSDSTYEMGFDQTDATVNNLRSETEAGPSQSTLAGVSFVSRFRVPKISRDLSSKRFKFIQIQIRMQVWIWSGLNPNPRLWFRGVLV